MKHYINTTSISSNTSRSDFHAIPSSTTIQNVIAVSPSLTGKFVRYHMKNFIHLIVQIINIFEIFSSHVCQLHYPFMRLGSSSSQKATPTQLQGTPFAIGVANMLAKLTPKRKRPIFCQKLTNIL